MSSDLLCPVSPAISCLFIQVSYWGVWFLPRPQVPVKTYYPPVIYSSSHWSATLSIRLTIHSSVLLCCQNKPIAFELALCVKPAPRMNHPSSLLVPSSLPSSPLVPSSSALPERPPQHPHFQSTPRHPRFQSAPWRLRFQSAPPASALPEWLLESACAVVPWLAWVPAVAERLGESIEWKAGPFMGQGICAPGKTYLAVRVVFGGEEVYSNLAKDFPNSLNCEWVERPFLWWDIVPWQYVCSLVHIARHMRRLQWAQSCGRICFRVIILNNLFIRGWFRNLRSRIGRRLPSFLRKTRKKQL